MKIMWPRTDEERRRYCGFVQPTAKDSLDGEYVDGKMGQGRARRRACRNKPSGFGR